MGHRFAEIAFTDTVKKVQEALGSRRSYARMEASPDVHDELGPDEREFIGLRDSFYMASVSETGWPYVQHRGGPAGFVRVLDKKTIGFADFSGNRQYISVGNVMKDDRVALFFMDYRNQARLKILGRATLVTPGDEATLDRLKVQGYKARVERGFVVRIEGFDWNCPQHITQRFTLPEIEEAVAPLYRRIRALEEQLAAHGGADGPTKSGG